MKYEKPKVTELSSPLKAIQSFVKPIPIFYDAMWDPQPSNCAYEADE